MRSILAFVALFSFACNGKGTGDDSDGPIDSGAAPDTDGDGLSDADEAAWGSDPDVEDSDGDGLSDGLEVHTYGSDPIVEDTDGDGYLDGFEVYDRDFDPTVDPTRFNPLLADIPQLEFTLAEPPQIGIYATESGGTTTSIDTTSGVSSMDEISTTTGNSQSSGTEFSSTWDVRGSAGFEGLSLTGSVEGGYGETSTTSSELSWSHSQEQASAIETSYEQTVSTSQESGWELTGGYVYITVLVSNVGHVGFTVEHLQLILQDDPPPRGDFVTITTLSADTGETSFPTFDLAGGGSQLLALTNDIDLTTAKSLLTDSSGLLVVPGPHRILDAQGDSFVEVFERLEGRTATVAIDFGPDHGGAKRFRVATNVERDEAGERSGLTMDRLFGRYLPYEVETTTVEGFDPLTGASLGTYEHLGSLGGVAMAEDLSGYWVVRTDAESVAGQEVFNFSDIVLRAGDVLSLVYVDDLDLDRVGGREETLRGTDPEDADSDDDGLDDGEEVILGWRSHGADVYGDPARADGDHDGVGDADERARGLDGARADSDGDGIGDAIDWGAIADVEVGEYATCALSERGAVRCVGAAWWEPAMAIVDGAPAGEGWVEVSVGEGHACARDAAGELSCWGDIAADVVVPSGVFQALDSQGSLTCGIDEVGAVTCWSAGGGVVPVPSPTGIGFVDLSTHDRSVCALDGAGAVSCWGTTGAEPVLSDPPTSTGNRQLTGGSAHPCVLDSAGGVECWGLDSADWFSSVNFSNATAIASLEYGVCALDADGVVACAGQDTQTSISGTPTASGFGRLAAGPYHGALIDTEGNLSSWGWGPYAQTALPDLRFTDHRPQLALSSGTSCSALTEIGLSCWTRDPITDLPMGAVPTVSVNTDGVAYGCSVLSTGELSCYGDDERAGVLAVVPGGTDWWAVATTYNAACAIGLDGAMECWGRSSSDHVVEHPTTGFYTSLDIVDTAGCALTDAGAIECWGSADALTAAPGGAYTRLDVGSFGACAVSTEGEVVCWGDADLVNDRPVVPCTDVAVGYLGGACAIDSLGELRCWGGAQEPDPGDVLPPYAEISAGDEHFCVLNGAGAHLCWGSTGVEVTGAPR